MENSSYVSISRQISLLRDFDITANNIANTNTGGYKRDSLIFKEYVDNLHNPHLSFSEDNMVSRDNSSGTLQYSGGIFDLAVVAQKHYFAVETPYGQKFVKSGNFHIDNNNRLVNSDGFSVLAADGGDIVLPKKYDKVMFTTSGEVVVDEQKISTVGVFSLPNDLLVTKSGNSLFGYDGQAEIPTDSFQVVQGFLENSNVMPVIEMAKMLGISRDMEGISNLLGNINHLNHQILSVLLGLRG